MNPSLSAWQYALLLILVPPVGAFLVCTSGHIRTSIKIMAVVYCAAVLLILLTLRMPAGRIHIDAEPMI